VLRITSPGFSLAGMGEGQRLAGAAFAGPVAGPQPRHRLAPVGWAGSLWGLPPRAPTDPYVPFQAYGSSYHELATG